MLYRAIFFLVFVAGGYAIGLREGADYQGILWGAGIGLIALILEYVLTMVGFGTVIGGLAGLSIGLLFAKLIYFPLRTIFTSMDGTYIGLVFNALFGYSGLLLGLRAGKDFTLSNIIKAFRSRAEEGYAKVIDTSVIIDGRIVDVCEAGFIEGTFIIPQFILQELQHIADSTDSLRRTRGRRGLDILHKIQKMTTITVKIVDEDFPQIKEVDAKLVALARMMGAKIITNDFNLNKVAELQGVTVLNLNELANAVKPVVLPGERMNIFIAKEGKESSQGVGYLDDGTMVVVDNARRRINQQTDVIVTSVLQTTAGRMIFAKLKEDADREELKMARH
ncbi:MAG TPA: PIN domain-containing protein [Nitrospirae bacterium]|nr:putative PIN and TRAM-domain containing protein precursor [bacterium BMS3Abin06]HDH11267.1 PIN domain-containing protein [Nitrospirota bacterium]HDY99899.1 PIN domain-containing protein [Nitrospirota bacterium]